MQEAIPGAIFFHVVEHDRALWSRVAQIALWELASHAPPYVGSTLSLQKLAAIDGRVFHNVLDAITGIAFEDIARLCLRGYNASRALCIDTSPRSVSQIFGEEVAVRPTLLVILGGAACACARVQHRLVHGMAAFGGLLACADFAADVR